MTQIKIEILNKKKFEKQNYTIEVTKIDDYYYTSKRESVRVVDSPSKVELDSRGSYLVTIDAIILRKIIFFKIKKKIRITRIINTEKEDYIRINLDEKHSEITSEAIKQEYNQIRSDRDKCFFLHEKFNEWGDVFECSVCNRRYCYKHRVPESHGCTKPGRPGSFREVYSGGSTYAYGK